MSKNIVKHMIIGWFLISAVIASDEFLPKKEGQFSPKLISRCNKDNKLLEEEARKRIKARRKEEKTALSIWKQPSKIPPGIVRRLRSSDKNDKPSPWTRMRNGSAISTTKAASIECVREDTAELIDLEE